MSSKICAKCEHYILHHKTGKCLFYCKCSKIQRVINGKV